MALSSLIQLDNDLSANQTALLLINPISKWEDMRRLTIETTQQQALSADPDSVQWITDNRAFVKNIGIVNFELDMNGETFLFAAGSTYCCSPAEQYILLGQAFIQGKLLDFSDVTDYLINGVVQFFAE